MNYFTHTKKKESEALRTEYGTYIDMKLDINDVTVRKKSIQQPLDEKLVENE